MAAIVENEIVQLHPERCKNPAFAGCLMTVVEVKQWGVVGQIQGVGKTSALGKPMPGGIFYYRAAMEEIMRTGGVAQWKM